LEDLKGRDHREDVGIDGNTIRRLILEKFGESVLSGCVLWAVVNMIVNLRVP
jgi:hypothetical protein